MLLGCQQVSVSENAKETEINNPKGIYTSEEAVENGDIVDSNGDISNLHKFDKFIKNVKSSKKDEIRITEYGYHGGAVFYNLNYDGNKIQYTYDSSQDLYRSSSRVIKSTSCSNIESEIFGNEDEYWKGTIYSLSECSSSEVGNTFGFMVLDYNR